MARVMTMLVCLLLVHGLRVGGTGEAIGADASGAEKPAVAEVRKAVDAGLRIVENAARRYPENRSCFSCHHQTLPVLAMVTARDRGFAIDESLIADQAAFSLETRSVPIQKFFDNGDPHGKHQFISVPATAWAVAGLAAVLPRDPKDDDGQGSAPPP